MKTGLVRLAFPINAHNQEPIRSLHAYQVQCTQPIHQTLLLFFFIFEGLIPRQLLQKWEGSGELCILCPAVVQSCHSILSHFTIHHCLISNNSLENGDREPRHLSTTVGALKALEL